MWGVGGVVVLSDAPGGATAQVVGGAIVVVGRWKHARERQEAQGESVGGADDL